MVNSGNKTSCKSLAFYTSPIIEVLGIQTEDLLCVSGGTEGIGEGTGGWFDGTENLTNGDTTGWF